jgi:sec-independent protein translocase protein TatC
MTLLEHLIELRNRLIVAALALAVGTGASFFFAKRFVNFLTEPARNAVPDFKPVFTEPMEYVVVYFKVALLGGLALAMPVILYEVLAFVTPALTKQEKRWLLPTIFGATGMFLAGMAFAYFVALPPSMRFLLTFGEGEVVPVIKIASYIDFVTRLVFWIGVSFETPLVIMFLARLGIVHWRKLLGWWRFAIVIAFVVAAVVTPTIDPVTQSLVAGPILVLYFMGIVLARIVQRPSRF